MQWIVGLIVLLIMVVLAIIIVVVRLPFWKTDLQKILAMFLSIGIFLVLPLSIFVVRFELQPIKTAYVEVVWKRVDVTSSSDRHIYYATFQFSDGARKEFNVKDDYNDLQMHDVGVLSYKQLGDGTKPGEIRFVGFEKNAKLSENLPSEKANPFVLPIFILAWTLYIGGLGGGLVWSMVRHKRILAGKGKSGKKIRQTDPSKIGMWLVILLLIPFVSVPCIGGIILIIVSGKDGMTGLIVFLAIFEVLFIALAVWLLYLARKNLAQPLQKVQARVLEKGAYSTRWGRKRGITYYVTFVLADGTRMGFELYATAYARLQENAVGMLYYKERGINAWFLGFDPIDEEKTAFDKQNRMSPAGRGEGKEPQQKPVQQLPYSKAYYEQQCKNCSDNIHNEKKPVWSKTGNPVGPVLNREPPPAQQPLQQPQDAAHADQNEGTSKATKRTGWLDVLFGVFPWVLTSFVALYLFLISFQKPVYWIGFILVVVLMFIEGLSERKRKRMKTILEQKVTATILGKGHQHDSFYIDFLFPQGESKRVWDVPFFVYRFLVKGDTGELTFKEGKNKVVFVRFKRNRDQ